MAHTRKPFTGKHMAAIFVAGFAIVIAVNLLMASIAVGSFHGTVVDNSYVASQNYNGWLKQAAASRALGWQAVPHRRADGRVLDLPLLDAPLERVGHDQGFHVVGDIARALALQFPRHIAKLPDVAKPPLLDRH